jgi:hypothetical protein
MKLKLNQTPRKNIASLFLCNKIFQKQKKTEGKAILLPASCDAGKNMPKKEVFKDFKRPDFWQDLQVQKV